MRACIPPDHPSWGDSSLTATPVLTNQYNHPTATHHMCAGTISQPPDLTWQRSSLKSCEACVKYLRYNNGRMTTSICMIVSLKGRANTSMTAKPKLGSQVRPSFFAFSVKETMVAWYKSRQSAGAGKRRTAHAYFNRVVERVWLGRDSRWDGHGLPGATNA